MCHIPQHVISSKCYWLSGDTSSLHLSTQHYSLIVSISFCRVRSHDWFTIAGSNIVLCSYYYNSSTCKEINIKNRCQSLIAGNIKCF